jgi:hypothetical protein
MTRTHNRRLILSIVILVKIFLKGYGTLNLRWPVNLLSIDGL